MKVIAINIVFTRNSLVDVMSEPTDSPRCTGIFFRTLRQDVVSDALGVGGFSSVVLVVTEQLYSSIAYGASTRRIIGRLWH